MLYLTQGGPDRGVSGGGAMEGAREILKVLAMAFAGLVLAALAAFTPWYDGADRGPGAGQVVEMREPAVVVAPAVER